MNTNSNLEFRKVKSLMFLYEINENGTILRNVKSKRHLRIFLDMHHSDNGYYASFVNLKGKVVRVMIHKLVAECWLGDRPEGLQIDHIDRNSRNNHYTNLRYVTHGENMKNRVLSPELIARATNNCLQYTLKYVAKPVVITSDFETKEFRSMIECSKYLGAKYDVTAESVRAKLKKRRKHIFDYDITYLNVETGRADSKE